jgi:hypothetical protein
LKEPRFKQRRIRQVRVSEAVSGISSRADGANDPEASASYVNSVLRFTPKDTREHYEEKVLERMVALQIGLWRSFSMWNVCLRRTFNLDRWCTCQCYCGCTTATSFRNLLEC